ncbi:benzoylformate decarboxylase [Gordonia rhizosphera]|uniref:acetolactate synthase n=1 Tax=Gordonia rhizosphera NBRC 16068 TaxID=1108045 RepID=K6WB66_9ACTN|nr:benzoylformate decarboxylase [Gordonia rhizosphera]GAB91006.1 benzoylformate decarboxylase [Gordonia rhizosphera NBRC 16068]
MDVPSVREATYGLLRELGLTTVFGNPGSTEETFLQGFPDDFRFILGLHEASVVAVADGYAQATRSPALVNVHTAAGLSNAMGTLLTAAQNHTPLIVTAGQQTREMLLLEPWLVNAQPEILARPWVKWSYQPVRPQDIPAAFMRAYAVASQPPAGPVFLSLPLDDWDAPSTVPTVVRGVTLRVAPDPARIAEFASAISSAANPVLVLGADVARGDGWNQAVTLADKLGVPVWAAPASERPPFPEDHPLYAGGLPFAQGLLSERLDGHDLIMVIGAPVFRYYPWVGGPYIPDGSRLLHITSDPGESGRAPVGDSLIADPVLALEALSSLVAARSTQATVVTQAHRMAPHPPAEHDVPDPDEDSELTARSLFRVLRAAAPTDTVLVEESPSNLADLHAEWPVTEPDAFWTFASGALGWNLPAAVGIALAERDSGRNRPVLAVIGDGSLQYSIQALYTAARYALPLVVVVPSNNEYAILKAFAVQEKSPGVPGLDIPGLSSVSLGEGYGVTGVRVNTARGVRDALAAAWDRDGPTLIEVPIDPMVPTLM